ncbi:hypothetical protein ACVJGD_006378 [Bradyrhizobium sp. USDA 10063]
MAAAVRKAARRRVGLLAAVRHKESLLISNFNPDCLFVNIRWMPRKLGAQGLYRSLVHVVGGGVS